MSESVLTERLDRETRKRFEEWKFEFAEELVNLMRRYVGNLCSYGDRNAIVDQLARLVQKVCLDQGVSTSVVSFKMPEVELAVRNRTLAELLKMLPPIKPAPPATPAAGDTTLSPESNAGPGPAGDTPPPPNELPF